MKILYEKYGFEFKLTHLAYISEEFTMEVTGSGGRYIVRLEQSARFEPPSVYYNVFEDIDETVEFVETIFADYGVEGFIKV